jgi:hypothetical protein
LRSFIAKAAVSNGALSRYNVYTANGTYATP